MAVEKNTSSAVCGRRKTSPTENLLWHQIRRAIKGLPKKVAPALKTERGLKILLNEHRQITFKALRFCYLVTSNFSIKLFWLESRQYRL